MIVILGESGSGKSTLVDALVAHDNKYKKIVTYTTRPKREGETNGVDYHFISNETFDELAKRNFFIEFNMYRNWYYGTAITDCSNNNFTVAVLTPAGMRELKRKGIEVHSIYLYVDRRSRLIKILNRGDDIEEAYRRSLSDVGQFDGLIEESDFIIDNTEYKMPIDGALRCLIEILNRIKEEDNNNGD